MYLSTWGTRILTANVHIHITAFHLVSFPYHKNHTGERNYCACSPGKALGDLVSSFQTTFSKKKTQNTYQILVFYSNVVNLTYPQNIDNLFSPPSKMLLTKSECDSFHMYMIQNCCKNHCTINSKGTIMMLFRAYFCRAMWNQSCSKSSNFCIDCLHSWLDSIQPFFSLCVQPPLCT